MVWGCSLVLELMVSMLEALKKIYININTFS